MPDQLKGPASLLYTFFARIRQDCQSSYTVSYFRAACTASLGTISSLKT